MTDPVEPPEERNPFEPPDPSRAPVPPPPPPPPPPPQPEYRYSAGEQRRYDTRTMLWTTGIVVAVVAVATWIVPFVGLLVPLVLIASLFFLLNSNPTVRYRSVLAGVLLGLGIGLFVTAGICSAVFSGNLYTPLFS